MAMVLNVITLKCLNYITIIMLTPTHGHCRFFIKYF